MKPQTTIIKRFIDGRMLSDDDIVRSVTMRIMEALRERDRAEGREPYPSRDGKVLSIGIYVDFTDRPGLLKDGRYPGGKGLDRVEPA